MVIKKVSVKPGGERGIGWKCFRRLIELIVSDDAVEEVVQTIIEASQTGSIGDGKIFVSDISNVYRVRTGEHGDTAI